MVHVLRSELGGLLMMALCSGCAVLPPAGSNMNDNAPPNGGTPNGGQLMLTLTTSNNTPVLGEEVVLTCRVSQGMASPGSFTFQPTSSTVLVDRDSGTARFIVDAVDIGTERRFTCSADDLFGKAVQSAPVSVFPS